MIFLIRVNREANQKEKSKALLTAFHKLLPSLPFKTDFTWSGDFSSSKDGLPYIGAVPERKNTFFALGFGGNGIVFSVVAAQIITGLLTNKKDPDADIFSFNRLSTSIRQNFTMHRGQSSHGW